MIAPKLTEQQDKRPNQFDCSLTIKKTDDDSMTFNGYGGTFLSNLSFIIAAEPGGMVEFCTTTDSCLTKIYKPYYEQLTNFQVWNYKNGDYDPQAFSTLKYNTNYSALGTKGKNYTTYIAIYDGKLVIRADPHQGVKYYVHP